MCIRDRFDVDPEILEQYTANQGAESTGGGQFVPAAAADDGIPF